MLNKTKKMFPVFIALAIFVFLLVINYNTPMIGEDFALSPSFYSKENFSFLNSIHWIVDRVYIQSTTWNARIGEQLAIVFLTFNKDIFNICNSILTMIYGYLIFLYAFNRKLILKNKQDTFSILVIFVLVVLFMPALGEIFFGKRDLQIICGVLLYCFYLVIPLEECLRKMKMFSPIAQNY